MCRTGLPSSSSTGPVFAITLARSCAFIPESSVTRSSQHLAQSLGNVELDVLAAEVSRDMISSKEIVHAGIPQQDVVVKVEPR